MLHSKNITEQVFGWCAKPAFVWRDDTINFREFYNLTTKIALAFQRWGIEPGDRVLLPMNDTPAMAASFLGALWIGAVPVPLNPRLSDEVFDYILQDSRAKAAVCEHAALTKLRECAARVGMPLQLIAQDLYPYHESMSGLSLSDPINDNMLPFYRSRPDESVYWQYTSGTTGMPKAVQHTSSGMLDNTQVFARGVLGINENDRIYSTAKLFFGYGLGNSVFFNLLNHATALLDDRWPTPDIVLDNIARFRPTVFFSTPALYHALFEHGHKIKSWLGDDARFCSAGAPLPAAIFDKWKQTWGIEILDGIGATEVGHIFLCNRPGQAKAGSTGVPVQGYDVKLTDNEGSPVAPGQSGILWVRGPSVSTGYHNRPQDSAKRFVDGWYRTGDVFTQSVDGHYSCLGREDEFFKSRGRWVAPAEIESYVLSHFKEVSEAAVIPKPDDNGLVNPAICLVTRQADLTISALEVRIRDAISNSFSAYMHPQDYVFLNQFPKNDNGKLLRNQLIALAQSTPGNKLSKTH